MNAAQLAHIILSRLGPMSAMKLQKLIFYCQAWSLVWDDRPIFDDRVEAWANGPVVPDVYKIHKGHFTVSSNMFPEFNGELDADAAETIDSVLNHYGDKSALWLSDLTHKERPWLEARGGMPEGQRGNQVITTAAMAEYYGGL